MSVPSWIPCAETFRRLDQYLDRSLAEAERAEVEAHLALCATCAHEYRFELRVVEELRAKLRRVDLPADLAQRIAARLEVTD